MTFQADASMQGRTFEGLVESVLIRTGWTVLERRWREPHTLVEIDIVASDPLGEIRWIECKGSWLSASGRNGATRTDTAKKLVADAALLSTTPDRCPYVLATSNMPEPGTPARRWIQIALDEGWLAGVEIVSTFAGRPAPQPPEAA